MIKEYEVNERNSTVCGYPGRDYDWSRFCWDGTAIFVDTVIKGVIIERTAPLPWVDNGLIAEGNEYLHVPYAWAEQCTIYRVRPNDSMRAGEIYRGHRVKSVKAVKKEKDFCRPVWYWQLEFEKVTKEANPS